MKQVEITSKVVGRGESEGITSAIPSINLSGFALKSDLLTLEKKFSDFLNVPIIDGTINRWNELKTFLAGISEDYNLLSLLNGKADKSYVDTNFVTIAGTEDVKGLHNFVNGLKIGGLPITKLQDDVIYIDANLVVRGGVTMYSDNEVDIPSIKEEIGFAGYNGSVGLASFDSSQFVISANGTVSVKGGSTGLDTAQLKDYLDSNKYTTETWVKAQGYASASSLSSLQTKVDNFLEGSDNLATILSTKWTTDNNLINQWNTAYGWGDHSKVGYALKSYVDNNFVTLGTKQTIKGEKNFTGGLRVNNSPSIYYDATNKYWKLEGDLLVTGGVTMYGTDNEFEPSSIMDALLYDKSTLGINENGELYVKGGGSVSGDYLPLSGGTLTSASIPLTINRNANNSSSIVYQVQGNAVGILGFNQQGILQVRPQYGSNTSYYDVWHEGNLTPSDYLLKSSYTASDILTKLKTVDGYGSGLAADILGARDYNGGSETTTLTTSIKLYEASRSDDTQVRGIYDNGWHLYLRNAYIHDGTNSRTILHSGNIDNYNAGSATKLQTARTIWGKSFDGTGNVDGKLIITGADASSSQIEFTRDGYSYILGKTLALGTSTTSTDRLLVLTSGSATFQCDILPSTNNTYTIGAWGTYFKRIHTNTITSGSTSNNLILVGGASSDDMGVSIRRSSDNNTFTTLMNFNANGIVFDSAQQGYIRVDEGKNIYLYKGVDTKSVMLGDGYFKPMSAANGALKLGNYNSTWNGLYLKANAINTSIMFCDTSGNGTTAFSGSNNGNAGIYATGSVFLRPACTAGASGTITNSGIGVEINTDGKVLPSNSVVLPNSVSYQGLASDGTAINLAYISSNNNLIIGYGVASKSNSTYIDGNEIIFRYSSSHTESCRINKDGHLLFSSNVTANIISTGTNIQFKRNNSTATAVLLSASSFKPFDAATDALSLGTASGRWNGVYLGTSTSTNNALGVQFCDTNGNYIGRISQGSNMGIYSTGNIIIRGGCTKGTSSLTTISTGLTVYASGDVLVTGGITMYSDIRKKTILNHVELSLKQIADAPLIEHYYNSDQDKTTHVGSIAQYWANLNDWFCKLDAEGYYTMEIQNCALASAISIARHLEKYESKTDKKIRQLKKRISQLEDELELLKKGV